MAASGYLCAELAEAYSELYQIFRMVLFAKIVNGFQLFLRKAILDVWQGSEYASEYR